MGKIRPFILLGLRGCFFDPFCYSTDALVGIVEDATLVAE
jgi:hypothetical protein